MKRFLFLFTAISLFSILSSCALEDSLLADETNFRFATLSIIDVELPDSFSLNEKYEIKVTYLLPNGCTTFEGFEINEPELTTREVIVFGTQRTDLACTESITQETKTFNFIVLYNQPYTFRFWQGEDENDEQQYLEIEVPVN